MFNDKSSLGAKDLSQPRHPASEGFAYTSVDNPAFQDISKIRVLGKRPS